MVSIEPIGFERLEIYLAKIIALLKHQNTDTEFDWREELLGWDLQNELNDSQLDDLRESIRQAKAMENDGDDCES